MFSNMFRRTTEISNLMAYLITLAYVQKLKGIVVGLYRVYYNVLHICVWYTFSQDNFYCWTDMVLS